MKSGCGEVPKPALGLPRRPAQGPSRVVRRLRVGGPHDRVPPVDAKVDPGRWYCDHPLVDATGETYVLSKMWGLQTEPALAALADAFPDAKVTFRRAATGDE